MARQQLCNINITIKMTLTEHVANVCKVANYHFIESIVGRSVYLVNLISSGLFFHSPHIILLCLFPLLPLVTLLSLLLKLQIDLSIILLLSCGTVCWLIYVLLLITSLHHLH